MVLSCDIKIGPGERGFHHGVYFGHKLMICSCCPFRGILTAVLQSQWFKKIPCGRNGKEDGDGGSQGQLPSESRCQEWAGFPFFSKDRSFRLRGKFFGEISQKGELLLYFFFFPPAVGAFRKMLLFDRGEVCLIDNQCPDPVL